MDRSVTQSSEANADQQKSPPDRINYQSIFESATAGIAVISIKGEIIQANQSFCQLLGYSKDEILNLSLKNITHPSDYQRTENLYKELLSGRHTNIDYEKRYVRSDGSIFWGHPIVSISYDKDQTFLHFIAQVEDIDERRQTEHELIAAHQQLQNIIEFLPDATFVIDREKNVVAWNRAMEEKTGVNKEEILGRGDYAYSVAMYGERRPILIDFIDCPAQQIEAHYNYFEKKGETLFAERFMPPLNDGKGGHVWLKASPLYDSHGKLVGAIESIRDITERKIAENKLRAAHQQMQDIIDFLPDATFVIDKSKKVVAWNKAMEEMSGISKDEMIGLDNHAYSIPFYGVRRPILIDLIGSPDLIKNAQYDYVGEKGDVKYVEQYLPNLYEGKGAYVWATASSFLDKEGNFAGAIESVRDITDREQTEEKLKHSNAELDAFVYTISHDLRSPLTPIIGFAQHLQSEYGEQLGEEGLDFLRRIEGQGEKMAALFEDLLALAKVGYVERPSESVDLNELVEEIVDGILGRYVDKAITIKRKKLPRLHVPKTLMHQIFDNLVGNAVEYAGSDSGPIEIGGKRSKSLIRLYVRDHGPGIKKEEHGHIFSLFSRGSTSNNNKGAGVGLAIVQKIARLYDGRTWVEETPGGGCTFWVEMVDDPSITT